MIGGGKGVQGVLSMILCCHIFSMFQVPFGSTNYNQTSMQKADET